MKKITVALAVLFFVVPSVSFAAGLTNSQIQAILSLLSSFGADSATVASVQTALTGTSTTGGQSCYNFSTNLRIGQSGSGITALQTALRNDGESVTVSGSFDDQTASAVTGLQQKYANDILTPNGLQYGTGYVGAATRAKLNSLCANGYQQTTSAMNPATTQTVTPTPPTPQTNQQNTQPVTPTPTPSVSSTQTNSPWVDIKADGSNGPITMPIDGPAVTISWTSHGVLNCAFTDMSGVATSVSTSGSKSESFSGTAQKNTVTISCSALVNNVVTPNAVSDSVVVNVAPPTGQISPISVSSDSSPANVFQGTGGTLASFTLTGSNEAVKVTDLYLCSIDSIHHGGLANVSIMGVNASTLSIVDCDTSPAGTDFSLGSSLILPARGTASITVSGTVKTSTGTNLSDGETVQIKLVGQGSQGSNGVGQSSLNPYTIPSSDVLGRAVPVVGSGTLSASPAYSCSLVQTGLGNQSACLGSFTLSAMKEGITVNTIGIDMSAANAALVTNLTLKYHYGDNNQGAVLGSVITTPSANNPFYMTPVSFGTGRGLDISTSGLTTIDVYGNVPSGAGTIQLTLDPSTSGTGDMTGISASLASPVQLKAVTIQ